MYLISNDYSYFINLILPSFILGFILLYLIFPGKIQISISSKRILCKQINHSLERNRIEPIEWEKEKEKERVCTHTQMRKKEKCKSIECQFIHFNGIWFWLNMNQSVEFFSEDLMYMKKNFCLATDMVCSVNKEKWKYRSWIVLCEMNLDFLLFSCKVFYTIWEY